MKLPLRASGGNRGRVALIADSGGLYALYDARDKNHRAVWEVIRAEDGPIIVPVAILAELDYLLRVKLGITAEIRLLEGIVKGALTLEGFTVQDAVRCRKLIERYHDLDLGLADASVIATAERLEVYRILTVDERDFRAVRTGRDIPLVLLPSDRAKP
jgi:predicted nucleic acid-binding protein